MQREIHEMMKLVKFLEYIRVFNPFHSWNDFGQHQSRTKYSICDAVKLNYFFVYTTNLIQSAKALIILLVSVCWIYGLNAFASDYEISSDFPDADAKYCDPILIAPCYGQIHQVDFSGLLSSREGTISDGISSFAIRYGARQFYQPLHSVRATNSVGRKLELGNLTRPGMVSQKNSDVVGHSPKQNRYSQESSSSRQRPDHSDALSRALDEEVRKLRAKQKITGAH